MEKIDEKKTKPDTPSGGTPKPDTNNPGSTPAGGDQSKPAQPKKPDNSGGSTPPAQE